MSHIHFFEKMIIWNGRKNLRHYCKVKKDWNGLIWNINQRVDKRNCGKDKKNKKSKVKENRKNIKQD